MIVFSFVPVEHLFMYSTLVCCPSCLSLFSLRPLKILIINYISEILFSLKQKRIIFKAKYRNY